MYVSLYLVSTPGDASQVPTIPGSISRAFWRIASWRVHIGCEPIAACWNGMGVAEDDSAFYHDLKIRDYKKPQTCYSIEKIFIFPYARSSLIFHSLSDIYSLFAINYR